MKYLWIILFLASCGSADEEFTFQKLDSKAYTHLVNKENLEAGSSQMQSTITLSNDKYPIHISLYQNNKFYYDLPTLGDGQGEWKIEDGQVILTAKRTLFDMYIEVKSLDCLANELTLSFIDRFGPKTIKVYKQNAQDNEQSFCVSAGETDE